MKQHTQSQAQQMAFQQQLHLNSLQILFNGYKDVPQDSPLKAKLELAISELITPFLPTSNIIQ